MPGRGVWNVNKALGKNRALGVGEIAVEEGGLTGGKKLAKGRLLETGKMTAARDGGHKEQQGQSESIEDREDREERLDARGLLGSGV